MRHLRPLIIGLVIVAGISIYPTLRVGLTGFKLIKIAKNTLKNTQDYTQNLFSANEEDQINQANQLKANLNELNETLLKFNQQTSKNWLAQKIIADKQTQLKLAPDLISIVQQILTGKQSYVLLFQNTEELRATGGF